MLVLDASFSIPLFVSDSRSQQARSTLVALRGEGETFLAPTLWIYEVISSFQKLRHFGKIDTPDAEFAMEAPANFDIQLIQPDLQFSRRAMAWSQQLRRASAYDSFYLALVEERGCDLWTPDTRMSNAVNRSWVRLLA